MKAVLYLLMAIWALVGGKIVGHMRPFGSHKPPTLKAVELDSVPQPLEFFEKFVKPRQPVVFRGAAAHSQASVEWNTDSLKKNYGDLVVRVEAKAEQSQHIPVTDVGFGRDTIRHFADNFATMDAYIISQIPEPMEKDVAIPPCLRCGNIARSIQEVHVFIVGKGGKTLIHRDPYSNIHCVFNGTKDWILVDDQYEKDLYQSESSVDEFGGYSDVDVEKVDLIKFPNVTNIEYAKVKLNGGDCIFIPGGYWHQVRVNGDYNTAVSIWFSRNFKHTVPDWSNCKDGTYDFTPMSQVDVLWRFSGKNESLVQGHMDINVIRAVLLSIADKDGQISLQKFCRDLVYEAVDEQLLQRTVGQLKDVLHCDGDAVSASHVRALSVAKLKEFIEVINPNDESNTLEYEYSIIEVDDISQMLDELFDKMTTVNKDVFVRGYTEDLHGTELVGMEVFNKLDASKNGLITKEEFEHNFDVAVQKYVDALRHDPTTERIMLRHLRARDEL